MFSQTRPSQIFYVFLLNFPFCCTCTNIKFSFFLFLRGGGGGGGGTQHTTPHLVKEMKFGIFNIFLFGTVNKHPNCIKMKFEGDLTSIMVTKDFFVTATTTLFALTQQENSSDVAMDDNHGVGGRG